MLSNNTDAIRLDNVSKRYLLDPSTHWSLKRMASNPMATLRRMRARDEFWALKDVSLRVGRGETVGIIGHNGSGKSTLLRTMIGLSPPTRGTVEVNGRFAALMELGAGFHGQATGRQNAYVNALFMGLSKKETERLMPEIIEFSGLGAFIDQPMRTYSSGMYVRLGFSVAVHVRPEILVIDEVLAVGDAEFQTKCFEHFETLRKQESTIVLVTHALDILENFADRVILMEGGKVKLEGGPSTVVGEYIRERIERSPETRRKFFAAFKARQLAEERATQDDPAPVGEDAGG